MSFNNFGEIKLKLDIYITKEYTDKNLGLVVQINSDNNKEAFIIVSKVISVEQSEVIIRLNENESKGHFNTLENNKAVAKFIINNAVNSDLTSFEYKVEASENIIIEDMYLGSIYNKPEIENGVYKFKNIRLPYGNYNEITIKYSVGNIKDPNSNFEETKISLNYENLKSGQKANLNLIGFIVKPRLKVVSNISKNSTYVEEESVIEYEYIITNIGTATAVNKIEFVAPRGYKKIEYQKLHNNNKISSGAEYKGNIYNEIRLNPNEEMIFRYKVKLGELRNAETKSINAKLRILDSNGNEILQTPEFSQLLQKNAETKELERKIKNKEADFSDNLIEGLGLEVPKSKLNKTYEISGKAWNDLNKNGIYETNETVLKNVIVKLFDLNTKRIIKTTKSNDNGDYLFTELENGEYTVLYEYDTVKYSPTVFKAKSENDTNISEAIETNIVNNEINSSIAVTDAVKINFKSKEAQNLGLIENTNFDLELTTEVEKVEEVGKVTTNKKFVVEENKDKTIKEQKIKTTKDKDKLEITYKVKLLNKGEIKGTALKIGGKLPKNIKFAPEKNPDWIIDGEKIYTTAFSHLMLKTGEEKTVKLVAEINEFKEHEFDLEILEDKSENGAKDINSNINNNNLYENDYIKNKIHITKDKNLFIIITMILVITVVGTIFILKNVNSKKQK